MWNLDFRMRNVAGYLLMVLMLLCLCGCSKRSTKAAQDQDVYIKNLDAEIHADRKAIESAERKAHMSTADEYLKFQLKTDLADLDRSVNALPADDPKRKIKGVLKDKLINNNLKKREAMVANFGEFDELIQLVDDKQKFKEHLLDLQMKLHKGGFSAEEASSLTESFGKLALTFIRKDKKQTWKSLSPDEKPKEKGE